MPDVKKETADHLEAIATAEEEILSSLLAMQLHNLDQSGLDSRTYSLIKIATLVSIDAPPASYLAQVTFALESGVTPEEILGTLIAVAPQVGLPKVIAAAPELMLALGLELEPMT
jgi:alkylhydroperoxidase/carboxymuconolactone decarboxylase family protein YurZ